MDSKKLNYFVFTGNAKDFAWRLAKDIEENELEVDVNNISNIEAEEFLPQEASNPQTLLVVIISTYTEGTPPESAKWFYKWLGMVSDKMSVMTKNFTNPIFSIEII